MLLAVFGVMVLYLLYKAFRLYVADGDLTVMSSSLKPGYFKGRVVWVTGASSGSKEVWEREREIGCMYARACLLG